MRIEALQAVPRSVAVGDADDYVRIAYCDGDDYWNRNLSCLDWWRWFRNLYHVGNSDQ